VQHVDDFVDSRFGSAAGMLTPVAGALIQEAIDVAVILNALRAATPGKAEGEQRPLRSVE
jgi:hypothetical protein